MAGHWSLPELPDTYGALGHVLARMRGERPQRSVAASIGISQSALQRYEAGLSRMPLETAELFDREYGTHGWIHAALARLQQPTWQWARGDPRTDHEHHWPPAFRGQVWIAIAPPTRSPAVTHDLRLAWGPWRWRRSLTLTRHGVVLVTGKGADDEPVRIWLTSSPPVFALFGIEQPTGDAPQLDIRAEWRR
jgi:hypothetical protein